MRSKEVLVRYPIDARFVHKVDELCKNRKKIRELTLICSNNREEDVKQKGFKLYDARDAIFKILEAIEERFDMFKIDDIREINIQGFEQSMLDHVLDYIKKHLPKVSVLMFYNIKGMPSLSKIIV